VLYKLLEIFGQSEKKGRARPLSGSNKLLKYSFGFSLKCLRHLGQLIKRSLILLPAQPKNTHRKNEKSRLWQKEAAIRRKFRHARRLKGD